MFHRDFKEFIELLNKHAVEYPTEHEIQQRAIQALRESLGVTGLIRFMQQYDSGSGNYTIDRQQWQQNYTVDKLFSAIKAQDASQ